MRQRLDALIRVESPFSYCAQDIESIGQHYGILRDAHDRQLAGHVAIEEEQVAGGDGADRRLAQVRLADPVPMSLCARRQRKLRFSLGEEARMIERLDRNNIPRDILPEDRRWPEGDVEGKRAHQLRLIICRVKGLRIHRVGATLKYGESMKSELLHEVEQELFVGAGLKDNRVVAVSRRMIAARP